MKDKKEKIKNNIAEILESIFKEHKKKDGTLDWDHMPVADVLLFGQIYEKSKKELGEVLKEKYELEQQHNFLEDAMEEEIRKIREEYEEPIERMGTKQNATQEKIDEECTDIDEEIDSLNDEWDNERTSISEDYSF